MKQENVVSLHETKNIPLQSLQEEKDPYAYVEELQIFIDEQKEAGTPITQAEIARRVGYSATAISLYMRKKYDKGDLVKLGEALGELLRLEKAYQQYTPQISEIAMTSQVFACTKAIGFIERHKSFGVIVGEAGIGKSKAFELYARMHRSNTLLLTMDRLKRSPTSFVQHLWCKLPGKTRGNRVTLPKASFLIDDIILHFREQPRTILIDESQFLTTDALETARSIQDQTKIGIVLGGTFDLDHEIGFGGPIPLNAQLLSRVRVHRVLDPTIPIEDLAEVIALYGVTDRAMITWLHQRCNKPGRRYRWVDAMLNAAHDWCVEENAPMSVTALKDGGAFTGLL